MSKNKAPKQISGGGSLAELTEPGETPRSMSLEGFVPSSQYKAPKGAQVKSMSPMIRPAQWPRGQVLVGVFTKMFETSPAKNKKGLGVEIIPHGAACGVAIPLTATLRTGLEISGDTMEQAKSPHLGRTVGIELLPDKLKSKKGQDAWHFLVAIYPADYKPASR